MCNITVSSRGAKLTDSMRGYAEEKVRAAIENYENYTTSCDVVLRSHNHSKNKENSTVEITLHVKGSVVRVSETASDMYEAIDLAANRVSRQLRKYKTRIVDKRRRDNKAHSRVVLEELAEAGKLESLKPESVDDELIRTKEIEMPLMTVDEAMIQLDLLGHDFYLFSDAKTGAPCVAYRRKSGGYGVLVGI